MHFAYSPYYTAAIGIHVFPIEKYGLVAQALHEVHNIPPLDLALPDLRRTTIARQGILTVKVRQSISDVLRRP